MCKSVQFKNHILTQNGIQNQDPKHHKSEPLFCTNSGTLNDDRGLQAFSHMRKISEILKSIFA